MQKIIKVISIVLFQTILIFIGILAGMQNEKNIIKQEEQAEIVTDIAVVNLDEGVFEENKKSFYFSEVMNLEEDFFVSENLEAARAGINNGSYAAYILIPAEFSQNAVSINNTPKEPLKAIVIVVDNYDIVKELGSEIEDFFTKTGRDGLGLGIYLIISAGRSSGVKYTAINNYKNKIAGYLLDATEAANLVGKSTYKPVAIEGRCLVKMDSVNVMQIYTMVPFKNEMEYNKNLKELIAEIKQMYPGVKAPRIPVLPETFTHNMISEFVTDTVISTALGLHKSSVELRGYLRAMSPFLIVGDAGRGKTNMIKVLAEQARHHGPVFLFDSGDMELYFFKNRENINYIENDEDMDDFIGEVKEISSRNRKLFEEAVKSGQNVTPKTFYETLAPAYILIDDMDDFIARCQSNTKEMAELLKTAVETGIGVVTTVHSTKPKTFDELNKWFKTSSNGLVIGNQGTGNYFPMVPTREMPALGEGLLYTNSTYERLLLPLFE